jgi:chromosome segregation ATPase
MALLASKELEFEQHTAEISEKWQLDREQKSGLERELEMRRMELREAVESLAGKENAIATMSKELQEIRHEAEKKRSSHADMFEHQMRDLRSRLEQSENEVMRAKHESAKIEHSLKLDNQRLEGRYKSELELTMSRLSRLKEEKSRVEAQLQDCQSRQSSYATKVQAIYIYICTILYYT